jgi:hypothetical protein
MTEADSEQGIVTRPGASPIPLDYAAPPSSPLRRIWDGASLALLPVATWAAVVSVVTLGLVAAADREPRLWFLIPAILLANPSRTRVRRALLAGSSEPRPQSERAFRWGTWTLCAVLFLSDDGIRISHCPHGHLWGVGPVGIAHSTVGGPCHNRVQNLRARHVAGSWYVWTAMP